MNAYKDVYNSGTTSSPSHLVKTLRQRKLVLKQKMSSLICGGHTSSQQLRPGAITSAFHKTAGKTRALTVCGRWHRVRENTICIRYNSICLQWFCVCTVLVCVCVYQKARKRRVSVGSSGTGLAHRQTNTLHYRPIYLINWANLSATQHSAMHNCQQHPSSLKALLRDKQRHTKPKTPPLTYRLTDHWVSDCLAETSPRKAFPFVWQPKTSNIPSFRLEIMSPLTSSDSNHLSQLSSPNIWGTSSCNGMGQSKRNKSPEPSPGVERGQSPPWNIIIISGE